MAFPTNIANRRIVRAVCWSLALHVAILWPALMMVMPAGGVPGMVGVAVSRTRLDGRLRVAPTTARTFAGAGKVGRRSVLAGNRRTLQPSGSAVTGQAKVLPAAAIEPADESAGLDEDDLRAYRLALAIQARPHWRYPVEARQLGQGGTVHIRVAFASNGGGRVSVERSSGYRLLDDAAQQMLRAALASARQPEALRGKAFSLVMPVVFDPGSEAGR
ncbi:MAG TPA: TonB family protein [Rhodocyclaceae bacterium]|nr:TonB family protein [Rhodocyclaceae bacterium]